MYSILIIEDEQRVADLLRAGLEENGYNKSEWMQRAASTTTNAFIRMRDIDWLSDD